jgi:DNA-binding winged helix-turn-helix (wHTH) protein/tetratricopeptide (TPR) repeat protein
MANTYLFGECRLDLSARELHCAGELLSLSPKVFDCIAYLIEHRDRAVGRDELIAAVWGRVDVTDTLLGQTVLKARRAVGDTGNEQNAIRTVPRFGYRWVAEVSLEDPAAATPQTAASIHDAPADTIASARGAQDEPAEKAASEPPASRGNVMQRWSRGWRATALLLVLAVFASSAIWRMSASRHDDTPPANASTREGAADATAVLPVEITSQGDWSWLRLGLMDLIATRMRAAGVAVVPSENVVALLRDAGADAMKKVAEGTGARAVILPSATKSAQGWVVRLTLHAADGSEHEVEARSADAIEAGREAADRLLALLGKHARGETDAARDLPAAELISRAEAALLTDDLATARHLLESAPAEMQHSPELRLRLAQVDFRAGQLDSARTRLDALLAEVSAESDPVLRARILNGSGVVYLCTPPHAGGGHDFSQAITLLENHNQPAALGQAYTGRAVSYAAQGRYEPAIADFSRARVALELAGDALALARVEANEGILSAKNGRYEEALAAQLRSAQRFERFGALNELADTLAGAADSQLNLLQPADALATTERALPLIARLENQGTRNVIQIERATALAANGRLTEATALLAKLSGENAKNLDPLLQARIQYEQAALEFNRGQFEHATALAAAAVGGFDNSDFQRERSSAWLGLTRALRAQGKDAEAAAEVDRLQAWAREHAVVPAPVYAALAGAERARAARKHDLTLAAYDDALALARNTDVPIDTAQVIASYGASLIADGELDRASAIVGHAARWADHDYACALLQVRYYRALGEQAAWRTALQHARSLAGERLIPSLLEQLPAAGADAARVK